MPSAVTAAFDLQGIQVPVGRLLPTKQVIIDEKRNATLRRIISSVKEVGLIEPIIVFRGSGKSPSYTILDGHTRFEALKKLGYETIPCLMSTEDDAYTYNHKVNGVPPIQEHFMIMKAIENGVSEERIATALDVDVASIRKKRDLLNGICPEAVEILKTKPATRDGLRQLRKVKPMRQIEMAELMVKSYTFTSSYAKCLLAATPEDQLLEPHKPKFPKGIGADEVSSMEKEMESLEENFLSLEETHGNNVLHLVLITAYLRKLIDNAQVSRFLTRHHSDIFAELQKLAASNSLEGTG